MTFTKLEEFIFEKASETRLPGLSAAIVKGDEVIWTKGFGFRDLERVLTVRHTPSLWVCEVPEFTAQANLRGHDRGVR